MLQEKNMSLETRDWVWSVHRLYAESGHFSIAELMTELCVPLEYRISLEPVFEYALHDMGFVETGIWEEGPEYIGKVRWTHRTLPCGTKKKTA